MAIVDVYDAMTSVCTYTVAFLNELTYHVITDNVNRPFDPKIVGIFEASYNKIEAAKDGRGLI